jgi:ketosteroid isomerase-like protein
MTGIRFLAPGLGLFALLACFSIASAQAMDPLSVLQHYYDARSRGDLTDAMSVVAPDATYTTGPCAPICVGVADIEQREVTPALANHGQYTMVGATVTGTTVTLQLEVRNDVSKLAGIDRFLNDITADVKDGKIVAYKASIVPEDPQTAAYLAFTQSRAAGQTTPVQLPAALPRTGELPVRSPLPLVGSGVALLGAGLVLCFSRRVRRQNGPVR